MTQISSFTKGGDLKPVNKEMSFSTKLKLGFAMKNDDENPWGDEDNYTGLNPNWSPSKIMDKVDMYEEQERQLSMKRVNLKNLEQLKRI